MARILVVKNPKRSFCLEPAGDIAESLKNISRASQVSLSGFRSRQPGLGVDELPTTSLRCAKLCFQQGSWVSRVSGRSTGGSFWVIAEVVRGRDPKDWFDIWGPRPGR